MCIKEEMDYREIAGVYDSRIEKYLLFKKIAIVLFIFVALFISFKTFDILGMFLG